MAGPQRCRRPCRRGRQLAAALAEVPDDPDPLAEEVDVVGVEELPLLVDELSEPDLLSPLDPEPLVSLLLEAEERPLVRLSVA